MQMTLLALVVAVAAAGLIVETESLHLSEQPVDGIFDVISNHTFRIGCISDEAPLARGHRLEWQTSGGVRIESDAQSVFTHNDESDDGRPQLNLVILSVQKRDESHYFCRLVDERSDVVYRAASGREEIRISVRVHANIKWASEKQIYGDNANESLTIDCSVVAESGEAPPHGSVWVEAVDGEGTLLEQSSRLKFVRTANEYTIPTLTHKYQGVKIRCMAFVSLPSATRTQLQREILIQVYEAPRFVGGQTAIEVLAIVGQNAQLPCKVERSLPPIRAFEFLADGLVIKPQGVGQKYELHIDDDEQGANLTIRNIETADFKSYLCRAHNTITSGSLKISLKAAPPPKQPKVSYLGLSGGVTNWRIYAADDDKNFPVIAYSANFAVQRTKPSSSPNLWSKPGDETARKWMEENRAAMEYVVLMRNPDDLYEIAHLHTNERYAFEFAARNAAGVGEPLHLNVNITQEAMAAAQTAAATRSSSAIGGSLLLLGGVLILVAFARL